jgi:hypothetical protein
LPLPDPKSKRPVSTIYTLLKNDVIYPINKIWEHVMSERGYWKSVICEYWMADLPLKEYCEVKDLPYDTTFCWFKVFERERLEREGLKGTPLLSVIEVNDPEVNQDASSVHYEEARYVMEINGIKIGFPMNYDEKVARLVIWAAKYPDHLLSVLAKVPNEDQR